MPASLPSQSGSTPAESETYEAVTLVSCACAWNGKVCNPLAANKTKLAAQLQEAQAAQKKLEALIARLVAEQMAKGGIPSVYNGFDASSYKTK